MGRSVSPSDAFVWTDPPITRHTRAVAVIAPRPINSTLAVCAVGSLAALAAVVVAVAPLIGQPAIESAWIRAAALAVLALVATVAARRAHRRARSASYPTRAAALLAIMLAALAQVATGVLVMGLALYLLFQHVH